MAYINFPTNPTLNQLYQFKDNTWRWNGTGWSLINYIQGIQGMQGFSGIQGVQGIIGSQGVQGIIGTQGIQGIIGAQGIQGLGIQGITGIQGIQGIQGLAGLGSQGITGIQGPVGIQGIQGVQGIQGIQGIKGIQGIIGTQGIQGTNGLSGIQGVQGIQGILGFSGVQGVQGIRGAQGINGTPQQYACYSCYNNFILIPETDVYIPFDTEVFNSSLSTFELINSGVQGINGARIYFKSPGYYEISSQIHLDHTSGGSTLLVSLLSATGSSSDMSVNSRLNEQVIPDLTSYYPVLLNGTIGIYIPIATYYTISIRVTSLNGNPPKLVTNSTPTRIFIKKIL